MKALLAIAILIVGLALLGLAIGFLLNAVRRTRARETLQGHQRTHAVPEMPPRGDLESPRGMWAGAGVSAALGMAALVTAAVALISLMAAPTRVLDVPAQAGGLQRDDSPRTRQVASRQRERLKAAGMPHPLIAVYHQPSLASSVVLFIGSSGHTENPAVRLKEFLSGLAESAGSTDRKPTGYPAGRLRGTVMCIDVLSPRQTTLATCGWADEDTIGVIATDEGDAGHASGLLLAMREDMEKKKS